MPIIKLKIQDSVFDKVMYFLQSFPKNEVEVLECTNYLSVIDVKPQDHYKLMLTFENHEQRIFDVEQYLNIEKFSELKNSEIFNSVRITFDSIEWPNHFELDPAVLYENSIPIAR